MKSLMIAAAMALAVTSCQPALAEELPENCRPMTEIIDRAEEDGMVVVMEGMEADAPGEMRFIVFLNPTTRQYLGFLTVPANDKHPHGLGCPLVGGDNWRTGAIIPKASRPSPKPVPRGTSL